jgi:D-sedoheptulose 7-phosphate isomerase
MTMHDAIERYWRELVGAMEAMPLSLLSRAVDTLLDCHWRGGTVFAVGNGGSAATASHFACDLAKGTLTQGVPAFRVVALTDNVPLLTAWANDTSYDRVFAAQLAALVRAGDALVAISASGNSPNVLASAQVARQAGATVIALTGQSGGALRDLADLTIRVPSPSIEQVEDAHLMIAHSMCVTLRGQLAPRAPRHATSASTLPRLGRRRRPITIVERAEPPLLAGEIEPPEAEVVGG